MIPNMLINKTELIGECHIFTGYKDRDGYGIIAIGGKNYRAHRYSYEIYNGEIPRNCVIHHTCATALALIHTTCKRFRHNPM